MMDSPAIISKTKFDKVQKLLKQKVNTVTPSRTLTKCTLLSGIAKCADCKSNYMLMTSGKSDKYRYYKPATKFLKGNDLCGCKNIPMQYLDDLIMGEIANRMLQPHLVKNIFSGLSSNHNTQANSIKGDLKLLNAEYKDSEKRLNNLYDTLAEGKVQNFDTLNEFIGKENLRLQELKQQIKVKQQQLGQSYNFSNQQIERFTEKLRDALTDGSVEFRKQRLKDFVDTIEIGKSEVKITASKTVIAEAMLDMKRGGNGKVRSSERKWRAAVDTDANFILCIKLLEKYHKG